MARVVGIIPARAGSKGIPGKNFRDFAGFPLLSWIVAAAKGSAIEEVYVSTDDMKAASSAVAKGCWTQDRILPLPFSILYRPPELCQDETPDLPVFLDVIEQVGLKEDAILVHLRPTNPFVRPHEIDEVVTRLLVASPAVESVRSVRPVREHPAKMYRQDAGRLWPWDPQEHRPNDPRQLLNPAFVAAGFVDAVRVGRVLDGDMQGAHGYIIAWQAPEDRAVDLDTEADWAAAERLAAEHGWTPGHIG